MKLFFLLSISSLTFLPLAADAKPALCTIREQGTTTFSGKCEFSPTNRDGSFSIRNASGGSIVPGVTDVSVVLTAPATAEVRALTVNGNNSRWGSATRSANNPACWQGPDFEVCAY